MGFGWDWDGIGMGLGFGWDWDGIGWWWWSSAMTAFTSQRGAFRVRSLSWAHACTEDVLSTKSMTAVAHYEVPAGSSSGRRADTWSNPEGGQGGLWSRDRLLRPSQASSG